MSGIVLLNREAEYADYQRGLCSRGTECCGCGAGMLFPEHTRDRLVYCHTCYISLLKAEEEAEEREEGC